MEEDERVPETADPPVPAAQNIQVIATPPDTLETGPPAPDGFFDLKNEAPPPQETPQVEPAQETPLWEPPAETDQDAPVEETTLVEPAQETMEVEPVQEPATRRVVGQPSRLPGGRGEWRPAHATVRPEDLPPPAAGTH